MSKLTYLLEWNVRGKEDPLDNEYFDEEFKTLAEAQDRRFELLVDPRELKVGMVTPIVKCCKQEIFCTDFTNTCPKCGADYNQNGALLVKRSQWENN